MKQLFIYVATALTAASLIMANQMAFGATTTIQKTTTTTIHRTPTSTGVTTTKVVTKAPAQNFFVCYNRVTKFVTRNVRVERCNPYGMCRNFIIPVHHKVTAARNCQINSTGCFGSLSKFSWYPSFNKAQKGLQACHNQPIVVQRVR